MRTSEYTPKIELHYTEEMGTPIYCIDSYNPNDAYFHGHNLAVFGYDNIKYDEYCGWCDRCGEEAAGEFNRGYLEGLMHVQ